MPHDISPTTGVSTDIFLAHPTDNSLTHHNSTLRREHVCFASAQVRRPIRPVAVGKVGIPPEFLRLDLLLTPGRTAAETVTLLEREGFEPGAVRQTVGDYPAQVPPRTDGRAGQSEYRFGNHDLGQLRIQLRASSAC